MIMLSGVMCKSGEMRMCKYVNVKIRECVDEERVRRKENGGGNRRIEDGALC